MEESALGGYKVGEQCEITVGEGDTILSEHFDKVVISMKEKETCYVKSKLDAKGVKIDDVVSKEKGLKFNMTLLEMNRAADSSELEQDERIERAQHLKDKGTDLFKAGNLEFAEKRYKRALEYLADMDAHSGMWEELKAQQTTLKCQCHLNLAACYLKEDKFEKVIGHCTQGLEIDGQNIKGLFRRGQAYTKLHKYDEARQDLSQGLQLDPQNKAIANQLATLNSLVKKEKQMYQRMF